MDAATETHHVVNEHNGDQFWFTGEVLHRDDDLPAVVRDDHRHVFLSWHKHGNNHRENDDPAVFMQWKHNGEVRQYWYRDDKLHREWALPAVVHSPGVHEWWSPVVQEWWVHGVRQSAADCARARRWSPLRAAFFAAAKIAALRNAAY